VFEEEAIVGTSFEVNLSIEFESEEVIQSLKQTINYVEVYDIVKKHFERPRQLLEMLAQEITRDIKVADPRVTLVNIEIRKLNPPIANFTGSVGITYVKSFSP
jgi:dihydroneopterin aldolase